MPASAPAFSVQYHPEAGPGPHDASGNLFAEFEKLHGGRGLLRARAPPGGRSRAEAGRRIASVLVIGSGADRDRAGACEFDLLPGTYKRARCCGKSGYRVVLANLNPATIMTDPRRPPTRIYIELLSA